MDFGLREWKGRQPFRRPAVYFLLDADGTIVYIGCSKRVGDRVRWHRTNKEFHRVLTFQLERFVAYSVWAAEAELIRIYQPSYNRALVEPAWQTKRKAVGLAPLEVAL